LLNIAIIIVYFLIMIGIGAYAYVKRETASNDGFFVANRRGSILFITGSLCATFIGASVVVGMTGRGYTMGLTGAWWLLVGAIGLFILGFFFARRVRKIGLYTLPELLESQYGPATGLTASILIVVAWIAIIAAQILAVQAILSVILPVDVAPWILMTSAAFIFIIYTILGGQFSIIRTDVVQFGILVVGILIALGLVLYNVGGIGELRDALDPEYFSLPINNTFGWYDLVSLLILTGATYVVGPDMYSRLFCARDGNVARASALLAGIIAIPIAFIVVLIGMGAKILYPDIASGEAFPHIIENLLPVGVGGIVVAALLAAIMSSADTVLLTTSTIVSQDIVRKISPNINDRQGLLITRLGILVIGIISLLVALQLEGIISSLLLAYTIFTSGVVIPVIAGFFKDKLRVTTTGAMAAIIGGGGTALLINRLNHYDKLGGVEHLELVGLGVCIALLFGVSWVTKMMSPSTSEDFG